MSGIEAAERRFPGPGEDGSCSRGRLPARRDAAPGEPLRIGLADAGYMGYFCRRHEIVNLDRVVNQRVCEHIRAGTLGAYIEAMDLDQVHVSAEALEFYCRNE